MIPQSESLNTNALSRVFKDTVATYKYYWFMSILNIFMTTGKQCISVWEIINMMVANAWYPVHYFKLSFGKSDSMYTAIQSIRELTGLPIDADPLLIQTTLESYMAKDDKSLKKILRVFTLNVPYWFLSPWIKAKNPKEVLERSQSYENGALYALYKDDKNNLSLVLNPIWTDYLEKNYSILLDFIYWNLTNFLQVRNPNVPNISSKLIRPESRKSLSNQHKFWNQIIEITGDVKCIYTGKTLVKDGYDLDHFIPWSFVTHDQLWNLMPADSSINSSKSDKIPDIDKYLPQMAQEHHHALEAFIEHGNVNSKILEDYLSLGYGLQDLVEMNDQAFYDVFYHTFSPMAQIAQNMGFELWDF